MTDFRNSTIGRAERPAFEKKYLEDNWAHERIEAFRTSECQEPLWLADDEHQLRFGGSALTILKIESGPRKGEYWVGTARYTNRGEGCGKTGPDVGKFKNAGGVPSTEEDHRDPTAIGVKEGVEEIAFCCTSEHEVHVLCPPQLDDRCKDALDESIAKLNGGSHLLRSDGTNEFRRHEYQAYTMDAFKDTRQVLEVHMGGGPPNRFSNVVVSWTPKYAALEVASTVFRLRIPDDEALAGILTADGPDESLARFAEDVYVVKLDELSQCDIGEPVSGYVLETTRFPNWPPTGTP